MKPSRFQPIARLGSGGMGVVYKARDLERDMIVALKKLKRVDPECLYRFKREFRSMRGLSHPNLVTLYELVQEPGGWFLTMEVVPGSDFIEYVRMRSSGCDLDALGDLDELAANAEDTATVVVAGQMQVPSRHQIPGLATPGLATTGLATPGLATTGLATPAASQRVPVTDLVDMDRLKSSLKQLATALWVLHAAGIVHRDLKPSNVKITPEGKVVLMDFGIVAELGQPGDNTAERLNSVSGTPMFIAPEDLGGAAPSPAADWYAFGVMIYFAVTGRPTHAGPLKQMLAAKRAVDPRPPSDFVTGLPEDLESLCMQLLSRDPGARPSGSQVLEALGCPPETHSGLAFLDSRSVFVGRERELVELHAAYERSSTEGAACVIVEAPSGMGKTSLLEHFEKQLGKPAVNGSRPSGQTGGEPIVLAGSCYQRERIPYKAFDGIVDHLSLYLNKLGPEARRAALPDDIRLLTRLFPVLSRVGDIGEAADFGESDAIALRKRAFAALRGLLAALARTQPLVLRIDDIQWADTESIALLTELFAAPAIRGVFFVLSLRSDAAGESPSRPSTEPKNGHDRAGDGLDVTAALARIWESDRGARLVLDAFSEREQHQLIAQLVERPAESLPWDASMWRELGGHPMLLSELARQLRDEPDADADLPRLEAVINRRVRRLGPDSQTLALAIALAGRPTPLSIVGEAAGLAAMECERACIELCACKLARIDLGADQPWLDAAHDKVRQATLIDVPAERVRAIHRRLAHALQSAGSAPNAVLARHWQAAGADRRAAVCLIHAGQEAAEQLAFDRAEELFDEALHLLSAEFAGADGGGPAGHALEDEFDDDFDDGLSDLHRWQYRARIGLARCMRITDRGGEALAQLELAMRGAEALGATEDLATIHYLRGCLYLPLGNLDGVLAEHKLARRYAHEASSSRLQVDAMSGLGDAYYIRGHFRTAHRYYTECIELAREHGMRWPEAANRAPRCMTSYFLKPLPVTLADAETSAALAADVGHLRAEMVARSSAMSYALVDMRQFARAERELRASLELGQALGTRMFEPLILSLLGRIEVLRGERARGLTLLEASLKSCREVGFAFIGPTVWGYLARFSDRPESRAQALREGEALLKRGGLSHNHLFFYRDAMETARAIADYEEMERYAEALSEYDERDSAPWCGFVIDRARALADHQRGRRDDEHESSLRAIHTRAIEAGATLDAEELAAAVAACGGVDPE